MKKILKSILPLFLPLAFSITLVLGITYVAIQQNYRISANDPQIQLAEDIATQLNRGNPPQYYLRGIVIDISQSLGTFISIYDGKGILVGSSALLNGKALQMPSGVFTTTKQKGETRFTWQPQKNVRIATVVVYDPKPNEYFVVIGRSLKEVEIRIDNLGKIIFLGWAFSLIAVFILMALQKKT